MGPCTFRPIYAWPLFERRCQTSGCNITAMKYAYLLLSTEACLASLPLLSRFLESGVDMLLLLPFPLGGRTDMQLQCLSLLFRTVALHCLLSAFWKFRLRARWSSPVATPRLRWGVCFAVCSIAASLSHRRVQFCLLWTFQLRAHGSLSRALAEH